MTKKTLKKVEIEIIYNIKRKEYSLLDHGIKILQTKDEEKINSVAKNFENDNKYNVTFKRI